MCLRYKIGGVVAVLLGVFLYGRYGRPKPVVPNILPPGDTEQIIVDPVHHNLIITTPQGTQTISLPDHPSVIDVHHDGTVKVTSPQYGFQIRPFAGVYYSDALRFGGGVDLGYWKRLDLGIGLAGGASAHTAAFTQLTYNVWDNVGVSLTYDHMGHIGGGITLRI
jgi:hypothetical protein